MNWKACFNIKHAVLVMLLLHVAVSLVFAEVKTFEKKYIYQMSILDSEASSTAIGRAQAEGLLCSEIGDYLIGRTEAKLFSLGPIEVRALTAALIRPETALESHDGKSFTFTAKAATDPTALVKALNALRKDSQRISDLMEIERELEAALMKINVLRKKLSSKGDDASAAKYRSAVDDLTSWSLSLDGYRLFISDNDREAVEAFTKAIELRKEEKFFYLCRERILEKIGEYQKAKEDLDKLMELSPREDALYLKRAALDEKMGDMDKALKDCTRAIEINAGSSEAYYQRGMIYEKTGNLPLAINEYHRALEKNEKNTQAKVSLEQAYQKLGKRDTPKEYYDILIARNPKQASGYYVIGIAYCWE